MDVPLGLGTSASHVYVEGNISPASAVTGISLGLPAVVGGRYQLLGMWGVVAQFAAVPTTSCTPLASFQSMQVYDAPTKDDADFLTLVTAGASNAYGGYFEAKGPLNARVNRGLFLFPTAFGFGGARITYLATVAYVLLT